MTKHRQTDRQTDHAASRRMKHKAACIECSVVIAVDERQTLVVKLSTDFRRYHSKVGRRLVSQRGATAADYQTTSLAVDSLPSHEGQTYHRCHRTYEERHRGTATTRYAHTHTHTHTHTHRTVTVSHKLPVIYTVQQTDESCYCFRRTAELHSITAQT